MASILNTLEFSERFKRDFKRVVKHPEFSIEDFEALLDDLIHLPALPAASGYREHDLEKRGVNWAGYQECHLSGDIVVIYRRFGHLIRMHRIGGHIALFRVRATR